MTNTLQHANKDVLALINAVALCLDQLVLGRLTMLILHISTQPGHPSVVSTVSTSERWAVNRHTVQYINPIQCTW